MKQKKLHLDVWISAIGAGLTIMLVSILCDYLSSSDSHPLLVSSMGASSILIFYRPHGDLSQPWHVFGGHLFAATVGLLGAQLLEINSGLTLAQISGLAVALTLVVMHYTNSVHPPGGGTTLFAVLSASQLGMFQIFLSVLLNVALILSLATIINSFFPHRRYPNSLFLYFKSQSN
ncbi:MAG: hypothetical protein RIT27_2054 [Pseudomonadota bacterium]|jgi:CBS-domain-containing membrane protein